MLIASILGGCLLYEYLKFNRAHEPIVWDEFLKQWAGCVAKVSVVLFALWFILRVVAPFVIFTILGLGILLFIPAFLLAVVFAMFGSFF